MIATFEQDLADRWANYDFTDNFILLVHVQVNAETRQPASKITLNHKQWLKLLWQEAKRDFPSWCHVPGMFTGTIPGVDCYDVGTN